MEKRILGRTGLEVGELSLGAAFITKGKDGFDGSVAVVRRALELGITLADTSADYGDAEKGLGWALTEIGAPCIVSTKLGPPPGQRTEFNPKDKDGLMRIVENSLKLLNRDVIDILMIHEPDRPGQYDWYDDGESFHGPAVELLQELKEKGVIRYTGLGGTTAYAMARIMATGFYDVVLTAFQSSPLFRECEHAILPEAKKQNMGVMLASPTQQGWLTRNFEKRMKDGALFLSPPRHSQLQAFFQLCDESGIEPEVLCLRWALEVEDGHTVLTGTSSIDHLNQNFTAVEQGPLPEDVSNRLDEIAAMLPFRPADEPDGCKRNDLNNWGPGGQVH